MSRNRVLELLDDLSKPASLKLKIKRLEALLSKAIEHRDEARKRAACYRSLLLRFVTSKWIEENKK